MSYVFQALVLIYSPQNSTIPCISSVFGFTSLWIYSFSSCHRFSIGLRSGDLTGVFHQFTLLSSIHCLAYNTDMCLRSLNLWPSGYTSLMNGNRVPSRILTTLHNSIKNTYPNTSSIADPCPHVHLGWMLRPVVHKTMGR